MVHKRTLRSGASHALLGEELLQPEHWATTVARRVLCRLEFHYPPKHASWLNMVEIEIGVPRIQCLDRRTDNHKRLVSEIAAWQRQRNNSQTTLLVSLQHTPSKPGKFRPEHRVTGGGRSPPVPTGRVEDWRAGL